MRDSRLAVLAAHNDLVGATELLRGGADPDVKDPLGYTPLMLAAARGHLQMVEMLLTAGADVHVLDDRVGSSALHRAAQCGNPAVALAIIRRGAHIDLQAPRNGHTALIDAVWHKRAPVVAALLDQGARVDVVARMGYTALDIAVRDGLEPIAALIRAREERTRDIVEGQPLIAAVDAGDAQTVGDLLSSATIDVNAVSPEGFTALMIASQNGRTDIVTLLLAAGADCRIVDPLMKATPGHKAGYRGHAEVARVLCSKGNLELDAQGPYNGYTALHDAVWHGHTETAECLVRAGARLDVCGLDGRTALDMARDYGYEDLVARLERAEQEQT